MLIPVLSFRLINRLFRIFKLRLAQLDWIKSKSDFETLLFWLYAAHNLNIWTSSGKGKLSYEINPTTLLENTEKTEVTSRLGYKKSNFIGQMFSKMSKAQYLLTITIFFSSY